MIRLVPVGKSKISSESDQYEIFLVGMNMKVYLVGMNMRARRSMNCIPRKVFTPMYINTP